MTDQTKPFPLYRICEALGACPDGLRRLRAFTGRSLADFLAGGDAGDVSWLRRSAGLRFVEPSSRHVDPRALQIGLARRALSGGRNWHSVNWHEVEPLTATEKADLRRRLQAFGA
jgi:hypothetical protein